MKKPLESHNIKYQPLYIGTAQTEIHFFEGKPDFSGLFSDERRLFVTDTNVAPLPSMKDFISSFGISQPDKESSGMNGNNALLIVPAGESFKTIETVLKIVKTALDLSFTRKDIFTGIGGGVITDMTAFAASLYKRGARFEAVPTTLLAMVDAAVGGKTGCDFDEYKNMIGAFFPAEKLYVFPEFVQSLPEDQYRSGFAEAVKTALLFNKPLYDEIDKNRQKIKERDSSIVFKMIKECVKNKADVVEKDLTEKNIRMLLNFGHTFGHALETCAGLGKINHGDAVAWGMSRALALSEKLGLCSKEYREKTNELLSYFGWETEPKPACLKDGSAEKLLTAMKKDKKNSSSKVRVILQKALSDSVITEASDSDILSVLN